MRLFIALPLSDRLKRKINTLQEELKNLAEITKSNSSNAEKIRWVDPDKIHLTLAFLGEVSSDKIKKITEAMYYAVKNEGSFECIVENGGVFPSIRRPRVLWVGITTGAEKITNIKKNLDKKLKSAGFKEDHRIFTPHLTIGRVKYIRGATPNCCEFLKSEKIELGNLNVSELQLIESILQPATSKYRIIESVKL